MRTIPYVDLAGQHAPLKERLLDAVGRVLDHGQFILGPEVAELEERIAERLGVPHIVGVNSGTDALVLALRARGIGPGDEVITVSHSFVASVAAICLAGARPVLVDVSWRTMNLDPALLEDAVTPRTRAVIPVHLNGFPADLDPITDVCRRHDLALIEDAAQAFGTRYRGESVGTRELGCFSLHPLKILSACGDAGFIAARSAEHAAKLRRFRNLGLRDRDHCDDVAGNSRLDTLQAAILLVKLDEVDAWIAERRRHATFYRAALAGRLELPPEESEGDVAIHSAFVVRHPRRDALAAALHRRGVDAKAHYPLAIHQQKAYRCLAERPLPVTERVVDEILSLPIHATLDDDGRHHVIRALNEALDELDGSSRPPTRGLQ